MLPASLASEEGHSCTGAVKTTGFVHRNVLQSWRDVRSRMPFAALSASSLLFEFLLSFHAPCLHEVDGTGHQDERQARLAEAQECSFRELAEGRDLLSKAHRQWG